MRESQQEPVSLHLGILGLAATVLIGGVLLRVREERVLVGGTALPGSCLWRRAGLGDCPGCGLTRSVIAFCHLCWKESLSYHPCGSLIVVAALLQIPYRTRCLLGRGRVSPLWRGILGGRWILRAAIFLAVALWVASWLGRLL